jgi:ATP-dependent phosphoenolpyruvate carboxykinase
MNTLDISQYGITGPVILSNLSAAALYEEAIRYDRGTCISSAGALIAYSGSKTGRSPKDKRIVKQKLSEDEILIPENSWKDPVEYRSAASKLAGLFQDNFKQFAEQVSAAVKNAGPRE